MAPNPHVMAGVYILCFLQLMAVWVGITYMMVDSFLRFGMYAPTTLVSACIAIPMNVNLARQLITLV